MPNHLKQFLRPSIPGYSLTEELYIGSRTAVYRALADAEAQACSVVIKVLRSPNPSFKALVRFRNQYSITKNLSIEGIIRPLKLEPWAHSYVLVMEDVGGMALSEYLKLCGSFSVEEVLTIGLQVADILYHLSQHRVLHKDINPANILIHPDTHQIWLTDFGLASLLPKESQELQSPSALEGTLAYIAPEQTGRMNRGIDYRSDFYGLGVTLYELLTGALPFPTDDPMELIHSHIAKAPVSPCDVSLTTPIPKPLSDIVLKLMAKNAEDRYQSALGLKHDLAHCLSQWTAFGQIEPFAVGQQDVCDHFLVLEKLYGREAEVQTLMDAFERVSQGASELMLVAGFSGIGKTAVVNEIHKPITQKKGYFIQGKFDQFNRNIPFSAFLQAFHSLMEQLLSEEDVALGAWKTKILAAVGERGQVLFEVIPELESIIGPQPPVPELSGSAAQNRFNLLFGQFIRVFTTLEHPLVIFLDDLQWIDSASLNLFNQLLDDDSGYLLILGAYRNNEVFPAHPLMLRLNQIRQRGVTVNTLRLASLKEDNINQLVADSLHCLVEIAWPLAQLVYQKTQGNPFFATQFLQGLAGDRWITFNADAGYWQCNLTQVRQLALTDDVVEFIVGRLQKLPESTQAVLKIAACMGNKFDLATLATVCKQSQEEVATSLWRSLQAGLMIPENETYKFFQGTSQNGKNSRDITVEYRFLHDRIQQAAYSMIPNSTQKRKTHLDIGKLLLAKATEEELDNNIFNIVNHMNLGAEQIHDSEQRHRLARLNLKAGQKAKLETAHAISLQYFQTARHLLTANHWQQDYQFSLSLYELSAEAAYLAGEFSSIEALKQTALKNSTSVLDQGILHAVFIQGCIAQNKCLEAIQTGLTFLALLGITVPSNPDKSTVRQIIQSLSEQLPLAQIESLENLPSMDNEHHLLAMRILSSLLNAVYLVDPNLLVIIVAKQVELSLTYGTMEVSSSAYANYGLILCGVFDDIERGYSFGQLALKLSAQSSSNRSYSKTLEIICLGVKHWKDHINTTLEMLVEAYQAGLNIGDIESASFAACDYCVHSFVIGRYLPALEQEMQDYSANVHRLKQRTVFYLIEINRQTVLALIQAPPSNSSNLLEGAYDESTLLSIHQQENSLSILAFVYINKLFLNYLFEKSEQAKKFSAKAESYLESIPGQVFVPVFYFYDALSRLSCYPQLETNKQESTQIRITENERKLERWAKFAPMNYSHKLYLVQAEKHRVLGNNTEAIELYDLAIAGAQANLYLQEEALANELAAKFYLEWGKERVAAGYLQEAYCCYARWGAKAKTDHLEKRYPQLLQPILQQRAHSSDSLGSLNSVAPLKISVHSSSSSKSSQKDINKTLDLTAVLKAAQALSESIDLGELLETLAQMMMQTSGADRLALLLPNAAGGWQVSVTAIPESIQLGSTMLSSHTDLPIQLIQYVQHTQEILAIDSLEADLPIVDPYFQQYHPRSVLCLPLLHQHQLKGLLYLQHQSIAGVFNCDRITIINFLCSQAAISLENAYLFEAHQQAEMTLKRQNNFLKAQQESALDGMLVVDANRRVRFYNQRFASIFKIPEAILANRDDRELLDCALEHLKNPTEFLANVEYLYDHPDVASRDEIALKDGRFLERYSAPVKLPSGEFDSRIWYFRDISDRKAAEKKILESQTFLKTILDTFPLAVFWKDREGRYISANQNFVRDAGFNKAEDIAGLTDFDMPWSEAEARSFRADDQAVMLSDTPTLGLLQTQVNADGTLAWLETNKLPLHDLEGNVIGVLSTYQDISDRKQLEKDQNRLIQILQSTSDFVGICRPGKGILWQNEPFRNLRPDLRIAEKDVPISQLYPAWAFEIVQQEGLPAAIQHGIWSGETALLGPSGEEIPTSQVIIAHKSEAGEIEYFSTILRDMSDRKRTEAALQLSEARATATFTQAAVGIVEAHLLSGKFIRFNDYFCNLLGYSRGELQNMCLEDVTHPDDLLECKQLIRALDAGKIRIFALERRFMHKNGSIVWVLASANKVQIPNGQPHTGVAILQDISDRKAAELALQDAQAQFHRMTENVPGMIYRCVLNPDGASKLTYLSSQVREIFELEPEAVLEDVGQIWARIHPDDIARIEADIQRSAETLQPLKHEHRLMLPEKGLRWVQAIAQPKRLNNGDVVWDGVAIDISDRKQAEAQLQRTNQELIRATRMKDEFLANMSHELRTPLNAILGMTEGLQDKVFGEINEQQLKSLTTIEQSGLHLLELINEILDLAKIESGSIELEYSLVSVTHLCQSSLTFIRQQSLEKGIQLHLATPWDLPAIRVDERRLRQVLINLLNNAVKFTPSEGNVTLNVALLPPDETYDQQYLRFAVTDTGIGIAPDELNRLFQPFVQIDSALNRQYEGTGLGLALVKRIVELHGGRVNVTSTVGVGSCFTIELPYETATLQALITEESDNN